MRCDETSVLILRNTSTVSAPPASDQGYESAVVSLIYSNYARVGITSSTKFTNENPCGFRLSERNIAHHCCFKKLPMDYSIETDLRDSELTFSISSKPKHK